MSKIAIAEFELGISQMEEGQKKNAIRTLSLGLVKDPSQVSRVVRMTGRRY